MEPSHIVIILATAVGVLVFNSLTYQRNKEVFVLLQTQDRKPPPIPVQYNYGSRENCNSSGFDIPENLRILLETRYHSFIYCDICQAAIKLINLCINTNSTFNKFRKPAEKLCQRVSKISKFNINMCSGIIDIYGPPVLYIADQLVLDPRITCDRMGFCVPRIQKSGKKEITKEIRKFEEVHSIEIPENQHLTYFLKERSVKPLKIVQLSDLHVDKEYKPGSATKCDYSMCCREKFPGTGQAGHYGEYNCDIPWWTVDVLVDSIKQMDSAPDFIVYTGDSPPHDVWQESWHTQYSADRDVTEFLNDRFDGIDIYPTLGNHELFPANLYYSPLSEYKHFNSNNLKLWSELFSIPEEQRMNIKQDSFYSVVIKPGLRLLSFNTNSGKCILGCKSNLGLRPNLFTSDDKPQRIASLFKDGARGYQYNWRPVYTLNFYALLNWKNPDQDKQCRFMEKTLYNARINSEKVIIIGHIPPGDVPNTYEDYGKFYSNLVSNYYDVIVLQLFGHTHRDQYELVIPNHDVEEATGVLFIAPSVTTFTNQNPAYRIYYLDPQTFQLLDYEQYYLNITKANENKHAEIEKMYSAKEEYNLKDMSSDSFLGLSKSLSKNDTLFGRYWKNRHARSDVLEDCDAGCRDITICETLSSSFSAWIKCVGRHSGL